MRGGHILALRQRTRCYIRHVSAFLQVAQTCQLALQRIQHFAAEQDASPQPSESCYSSVDPTPAAAASTPLQELEATLVDDQGRIFDRWGPHLANLGTISCQPFVDRCVIKICCAEPD